MADWRNPGLTARIVMLALSGIVLATVGAFLITFRGPPPLPPPTRLADLAAVIEAGGVIRIEGRPVETVETPRPPRPRDGERRDKAREARFSGMTAADAVRVYYRPTGPQRGPDVGTDLRGQFSIGVLRGGHWRVIRSKPDPFLSEWHRISLAAMALAALGLGLIAWAVARAIVRPLSRLAKGAQAISVGHRPVAFAAEGPPEVRQLGAALNAMQDRIAAQIENRTTMLAAVAHDLGTPLSRLAFHVDHLPDEPRARAEAEIAEMRAMIASVMEFAWADPSRMKSVPLDLTALAREAAGDAWRGEAAPLMVAGDPLALKRLIANLIENAERYGGGGQVSCHRDGAWAELRIEDDGPGIAPEMLARITEPFVRGEPSRNRETGGMGLGFAIVRRIAEAHGGMLVLTNRDTGLQAIVRLPIA